MKHFLLIIMLLVGGACFAQTVLTSAENEIGLPVMSNTLVRDCENEITVTYFKNHTTNTFDVRQRETLLNRHFDLNYELNQIGEIQYTVNDMCVYKRWCYFCGTKFIPLYIEYITYDMFQMYAWRGLP